MKRFHFVMTILTINCGFIGAAEGGAGSALYGPDCAIDTQLATSLEASNTRSKTAIESLLKERDIEDEACLPVLNALGGQISMSIPTVSFALDGLLTKVRDMACDALNSAIEDVSSEMQAGWEAPFGLGGVSTGVGDCPDGEATCSSVTQGDSVSSVIEGEVYDLMSQGMDKANSNALTVVKQETEKVTGVNRSAAESVDQKYEDLKREALEKF